MDIGSKAGYPTSAISNFAPHLFMFDGVLCASMEGPLQAFKYDKPDLQLEVCALVGLAAKRRGQRRNKAWKQSQTLWWMGEAYERHGAAYQALLTRAYDALAKNESFRRALLATGDAVLTHSIGHHNPRETVLTEQEFCGQVTRVRTLLQRGAL